MFKVGQRVRRMRHHGKLDKGELVYVLKLVGRHSIDVSRSKGGPAILIPDGRRPLHFSVDYFEAAGVRGTMNTKLLLC